MKLIYHESVLKTFEAEVTKFGIIETGGVLLGNVNSEGIIVTKAIDAGPNAIHENFYFKADNNYVEMMIDIEYANSKGKVTYIGEWHSHPQVTPEPSEIDLNSLREICESSGTINLLLILGAIDFSKSKFLEQSISIVKAPNETKFYKIRPEIQND